MSRRRKKQDQSFQQRKTHQKRQLDEQVESTAAAFACSTELARHFTARCDEKINEAHCEVDRVRVALRFWREAPDQAAPLVNVLRELEDAHERHAAALTDLRIKMLTLTQNEPINIDRPPDYQNAIRFEILYVLPPPLS